MGHPLPGIQNHVISMLFKGFGEQTSVVQTWTSVVQTWTSVVKTWTSVVQTRTSVIQTWTCVVLAWTSAYDYTRTYTYRYTCTYTYTDAYSYTYICIYIYIYIRLLHHASARKSPPHLQFAMDVLASSLPLVSHAACLVLTLLTQAAA